MVNNDDLVKINSLIRKLSLGDEVDNDFAPLFVGVCGGSASGKSTLCGNIDKELGGESCSVISLDSYYKGFNFFISINIKKIHRIDNPEDAKDYNFDHPNSLDFDLAYECLLNLMERRPASVPVYNFKTHKRLNLKI